MKQQIFIFNILKSTKMFNLSIKNIFVLFFIFAMYKLKNDLSNLLFTNNNE
jgi:hypothetical protein